MRERRADVLIVGGGLGGVAAALAAASRGVDVVMSEPTDWIGGQLTSQAVPPDEHPWIERLGCTATYRALRDGIRAHYRARFPLTAAARAQPHLNPGACFVSRLGHEPRVALAVLEAMLEPHVAAGRLEILREHAPVAAEMDGDRLSAVTLRGSAGDVAVAAGWFLEASETGALLPLAGVEHVIGFESQAMTGEPHAPAAHQPGNLQPVTVCFAVDHLAGRTAARARGRGGGVALARSAERRVRRTAAREIGGCAMFVAIIATNIAHPGNLRHPGRNTPHCCS